MALVSGIALAAPAGAAPLEPATLTIRSVVSDGYSAQAVTLQHQGASGWEYVLDDSMAAGEVRSLELEPGVYRVERTFGVPERIGYSAPFTLAPGQSRQISIGQPGLHTRDVTGDGWADVLVIGSGRISRVEPGIGMTETRLVRLDSGFSGLRVINAGDADLDGDVDLYARDAAGRLWFFPGRPTGGWGTKRAVGTGWNGFVRILSPGDFTGDGIPDLLAQARDGSVRLYAGVGVNGRLVKKGIVARGWSAFSDVASVGDWNGDGTVDLLALVKGRLRLLLGNGAGGWLPSVVMDNVYGRESGVVGVGKMGYGSTEVMILTAVDVDTYLPLPPVATIYSSDGETGFVERIALLLLTRSSGYIR